MCPTANRFDWTGVEPNRLVSFAVTMYVLTRVMVWKIQMLAETVYVDIHILKIANFFVLFLF